MEIDLKDITKMGDRIEELEAENERLHARVEALEYTIKTLILLDDCKESPTGKHTWLTGDDFNYCAFCNASSQATEQGDSDE